MCPVPASGQGLWPVSLERSEHTPTREAPAGVVCAKRTKQHRNSIVVAVPARFLAHDVVEVRVPSPMDGYHGQECYDGEDTGPGGVVYDSMLELAQEFVARCQPGTDPLRVVRDMLDDYEGEVEAGVREAVAGARQGVSAPNKGESQRGYLSPAREDDLLRQVL